LKKATCLEVENQNRQRLDELQKKRESPYIIKGRESVKPGQFQDFLAVAKWKRNYRNQTTKWPWYILTNLGSLTVALQAYKRRMGIEEMFRDCKSGGYNLEGTGLRGERLN
jgi:hypothetical protein